jgi:hypothetical protein
VQADSAIVVDVGARVVRRAGIDVQLAPKAFDLLLTWRRSSRSFARRSATLRTALT